MAVVATVGTTSTAGVDPVPESASVCRQYQMWLHIDAAYGGGLALLPECEWVKQGWTDADSLIINPHKVLCILSMSALFMCVIFSGFSQYLRLLLVIYAGDAAGLASRIRDHLRLAQLFAAWGRRGRPLRIVRASGHGRGCFD